MLTVTLPLDLQALGYDVDNPITCPQNPKSTETKNTSTVVVQIQQMQEDQEGTWKRERERVGVRQNKGNREGET